MRDQEWTGRDRAALIAAYAKINTKEIAAALLRSLSIDQLADVLPVVNAAPHVEAALGEMEQALRTSFNVIERLEAAERPIRSCGACGTPNAACDMDCMEAAYIARDIAKARAVLRRYALPTVHREEPTT